ncbi:MAG: hypothetical protein R3B49_07510 [Phycisphaerales bacterium]
MQGLDLQSADAVCDALHAAAAANRSAACRRGSIDVIEAPGKLIATGDLHDNPVHFAPGPRRRARAAPGVPDEDDERESPDPSHLTLHEIIHSDRFMNGMDFSYRSPASPP